MKQSYKCPECGGKWDYPVPGGCGMCGNCGYIEGIEKRECEVRR